MSNKIRFVPVWSTERSIMSGKKKKKKRKKKAPRVHAGLTTDPMLGTGGSGWPWSPQSWTAVLNDADSEADAIRKGDFRRPTVRVQGVPAIARGTFRAPASTRGRSVDHGSRSACWRSNGRYHNRPETKTRDGRDRPPFRPDSWSNRARKRKGLVRPGFFGGTGGEGRAPCLPTRD